MRIGYEDWVWVLEVGDLGSFVFSYGYDAIG